METMSSSLHSLFLSLFSSNFDLKRLKRSWRRRRSDIRIKFINVFVFGSFKMMFPLQIPLNFKTITIRINMRSYKKKKPGHKFANYSYSKMISKASGETSNLNLYLSSTFFAHFSDKAILKYSHLLQSTFECALKTLTSPDVLSWTSIKVSKGSSILEGSKEFEDNSGKW